MKTVKVAAAVIRKDSLIYAVQRGYGEYKDGWEFPGGKIEQGETAEEALVREIHEELNMTVQPVTYLDTIEMDYRTFHLSMQCYLCEIEEGEPVPSEAEDTRWLDYDHLYSVDWLPADLALIPLLQNILKQ